ncbi:trimeric intracellular cation channel family protein [Archaeoglobus veneficus]|uniref:Uncharacterized protein family UPF0126 n=1 Tax=Archaeoglobus veneficus (strain DSM 11195 / SNP6) TaxID=693661 RepID=F2KNK5_ARCVS|nr:trimeric intracellular cation channel family protein [Archaeoglobus veneficus]AEA46233.1 Uncharacterized protein family UPF0126 [Archaeoglobus veneficus SNP6]
MGVLELVVLTMNYVGVFAFAVSGALKGIDKNMDVFGCAFLGLATAFGGGITRDIIAGNVPPLAFRSEPDFIIAIAAITITICMYRKLANAVGLLPYFDAVGLGAFAALGGAVALNVGLGPLGVVFAAMFTGAGGGIIRDVLAGEVPLVFTREFYATAALIGGAGLYVLSWVTTLEVAMFVSALSTTILRIASIRFGWNLPRVKMDG